MTGPVLAGWTRRACTSTSAAGRRPRRWPSGWRRCRWPRWSPARWTAAWRPRPPCWPAGTLAARWTTAARRGAGYGDWTGQPLKELAKQPLWKVVQAHPSAAVFPGRRGRRWPARSPGRSPRSGSGTPGSRVGRSGRGLGGCSHGDIIKAVLADALGLHLDLFQRIVVDPCSVSVVRYTDTRPFVLRVNDTGGDVAALLPPRRRRASGRRRARAPRWAAGRRRLVAPAGVGLSRRCRAGSRLRLRPARRFVAGTVGQPGDRTFFLQARAAAGP